MRFKQRSILWYLVFIGFSVNYMIRININISIVDMIDQSYRKPTNSASVESECFVKENFTIDEDLIEILRNSSSTIIDSKRKFPSLERIFLDALGVIEIEHETERSNKRDKKLCKQLEQTFVLSLRQFLIFLFCFHGVTLICR